ncbi:alpha/beta fold hydrolase [Psychrobacillus sp. NPDC093200]|uniref:alpha/beta fold hydrolase n=1 Tax=Psychrobacillus sp. NPDC093200 TaxID=3390656 RepID=UPI003D03A649
MNLIANGEYKIKINDIFHWIKVEGIEHNTIPLVAIHGGPGGNHYVFEHIAGAKLSDHRTVIYYEQRGCGRSEKPLSQSDYSYELLIEDFTKILEWSGFQKVDLLGYSFGGELALEIVASLPEKIHKVITSCPSLISLETQYLLQIAGFVSVAEPRLLYEIEQVLAETSSIHTKHKKIWEIVNENTLDKFMFNNIKNANIYRKQMIESGLKNSGHMMAALQRNPREIPLYERLSQITNEILIITGVHDRNSGLGISNLIHNNLQKSKWVLFNESAHFPEIEETDKYVNQVLAFLES